MTVRRRWCGNRVALSWLVNSDYKNLVYMSIYMLSQGGVKLYRARPAGGSWRASANSGLLGIPNKEPWTKTLGRQPCKLATVVVGREPHRNLGSRQCSWLPTLTEVRTPLIETSSQPEWKNRWSLGRVGYWYIWMGRIWITRKKIKENTEGPKVMWRELRRYGI